MTAPFTIRPAELADLPAIRDIYNHYVRETFITFEEHEWNLEVWERRLTALAAAELPFLVVASNDGVLGYALLQPWSAKSAYRFTVENSIYLAPTAVGSGIGGVLLARLIAAASARGIRQIVAVIADEGAAASIRLHERQGFREVGRLRDVGFKFGVWRGIVQLQLTVPDVAN